MSAHAEVGAARVHVMNAEQTTAVADAAMAAYAGDLAPAAAWLKRIGCSITIVENGGGILWTGGPGVPSGAVMPGGDPVSPCIQLLFATLGPTWPWANGAAALIAVNLRWRAERKAHKLATA